MDSTSTLSPPISCARAARSVVAVMTLSLPAACDGGGRRETPSATIASKAKTRSCSFIAVIKCSPKFLEWMGAMRTHHEEKLKQKFVGVVVTRGRGVQQMAIAILSTDLAELARPVGQDTRKTSVGETRAVGVAAAIKASADSPAAIETVFGVSVHAESVLRLENVGGRELVACAPEEFGAEEERVVDGAAERLPAQRGIGGIKIGQECG